MNAYYTVMESRHRWSILAGISFTAAAIGAIMMIAWNWPHLIAQIWFYLGLLLTLLALLTGAREWWLSTRSAPADPGRLRAPGGSTGSRSATRPLREDPPRIT